MTKPNTTDELREELLHLFASAWQDGVHHMNPKYVRRDTLFTDRIMAMVESHTQQARIAGINEAHERILEIVYTYTGGEGLENFCDVDDVSRVAMSWKVDRIAQLTSKESE